MYSRWRQASKQVLIQMYICVSGNIFSGTYSVCINKTNDFNLPCLSYGIYAYMCLFLLIPRIEHHTR
ncbi:hypothetical protein M426DRAFT_229879 [Hypoxylon sp. CI-4A]|nr:hypothetical protein M426DRAFT_229879 [Hypoxylon sp. CI-4A]